MQCTISYLIEGWEMLMFWSAAVPRVSSRDYTGYQKLMLDSTYCQTSWLLSRGYESPARENSLYLKLVRQ